jgi:5-methyltetrahydrofolate--homocysteine methyltransferase
MLDVNAGIPLADEPAILAKAIQLVQSVTDVPLSIDSSIVAALEAGLAVYKGKALVNSVTGEDERLETVLPLVKKYGAAVIAISNDETGIAEDPDVRFAVAKKIVERAEDHGIPRSDVVVDPLIMPLGAINQAGVQAFLSMAIGAGMTSAITNPCHDEILRAVMAADALMGHDPHCTRWLKKFREQPPAGTASAEGEAARARREGRRRRG